jgi:hypothetical protein
MESEEYFTDADWRCQIVVRVAKAADVPGLGHLPAGAVGKGSGIIDYQSGQIAFTLPNATALFLNLSKRHYDEALALANGFSAAPTLQSLEDGAAFAYLENIMASVVFAYTALESFANDEIPDDYTYSVAKTKSTEVYNKSQIERFLTLEVKLGEILPAVCGVPSPKGIKVWQDYIALESLRHSIIHMKKFDREHVGYSSQSVWSRLIKDPVPYPIPVAVGVIDYFYKPRAVRPHWYENLPF